MSVKNITVIHNKVLFRENIPGVVKDEEMFSESIAVMFHDVLSIYSQESCNQIIL